MTCHVMVSPADSGISGGSDVGVVSAAIVGVGGNFYLMCRVVSYIEVATT